MSNSLPKRRYLSVSDIQQEYLPISKKKIRILMKKHLHTKRIGNRIFVERNDLETLLENAAAEQIDLKP